MFFGVATHAVTDLAFSMNNELIFFGDQHFSDSYLIKIPTILAFNLKTTRIYEYWSEDVDTKSKKSLVFRAWQFPAKKVLKSHSLTH